MMATLNERPVLSHSRATRVSGLSLNNSSSTGQDKDRAPRWGHSKVFSKLNKLNNGSRCFPSLSLSFVLR
eukprot:165648-Pelagomonas_calceolata.AAC.1